MIYIDLTTYLPDDDWRYEAWQLNNELDTKSSYDAKFAFIDANRPFWGQLKKGIPFKDKCWFSESKESVSVYQIEHFRPTKAVGRSTGIFKQLNPLSEGVRKDWTKQTKFKGIGYWWLAFNYLNYRNCGGKINNKKGIRFPLYQNSFIAYNSSDDYNKEDNFLIDPTKKGDPDLLTFDPDGKVRPSTVCKTSLEFHRAYVSIEIYGLNSIDTLVSHRNTKWNECYKAIRRAMEKYDELEIAVNNGNIPLYNRYFNEFMDFIDNDIKPAISQSSEFSAVAKACVLSYSKYDWIKDYVLDK